MHGQPPHRDNRGDSAGTRDVPHQPRDRTVPATVLIVDDHAMFAELLAEALAADGLDVVGTCGTLEDALRTVVADPPDLVVLDHNLPGATGTSGIAAVKRSAPATRVLMLTAVQERAVLLAAMDAGCDGFVTKRQNLAEVRGAVAAVLRDETPVSSDMVGGLVARRPMPVGCDLSSREADVLQLIGAGLSNRDIAAELRISVNTVRNHVQHLLGKLGAHSKLEAVAIASRLDLLRLSGASSSHTPPGARAHVRTRVR